MGFLFGGLMLILVIFITLFINLSPEFGGSATKEQKLIYAKSENYKKGVFVNKGDVKMNTSFGDILKLLPKFMFPESGTTPENNITVKAVDSAIIADYKGPSRLVWFGHSTFLLQMEGKNILIDPMFGAVPAPHPMLGGKRFSKPLPIEITELPRIDAVILSHDHYDHLDYGSIQSLKNKVDMFYTPLGVGAHLIEWGIAKEKVVEMDWWEETEYLGLQFTCTPAQHFSGRGLTDRGKTLWSSWVIQSGKENIFLVVTADMPRILKKLGRSMVLLILQC